MNLKNFKEECEKHSRTREALCKLAQVALRFSVLQYEFTLKIRNEREISEGERKTFVDCKREFKEKREELRRLCKEKGIYCNGLDQEAICALYQ